MMHQKQVSKFSIFKTKFLHNRPRPNNVNRPYSPHANGFNWTFILKNGQVFLFASAMDIDVLFLK